MYKNITFIIVAIIALFLLIYVAVFIIKKLIKIAFYLAIIFVIGFLIYSYFFSSMFSAEHVVYFDKQFAKQALQRNLSQASTIASFDGSNYTIYGQNHAARTVDKKEFEKFILDYDKNCNGCINGASYKIGNNQSDVLVSDVADDDGELKLNKICSLKNIRNCPLI